MNKGTLNTPEMKSNIQYKYLNEFVWIKVDLLKIFDTENK